MQKKVLLSGITGFLGSHIADRLLSEGFEIVAFRRNSSDLENCKVIQDKIHWINIDSDQWESSVLRYKPSLFIHSAWIGVGSQDRYDWNNQLKNIDFAFKLMDVAYKSGIKRFIGLGSQAEYGIINDAVSEEHPTNPTTAYGSVKVALSGLMESFCKEKEIEFYWLRLFSMFGEREGDTWLIPSLIKNILMKDSMDLTLCEQRSAYLYVKDVAKSIVNVTETSAPEGVYNISSDKLIKLKDLITTVKDCINPDFQLNFGKIPYRPNQVMSIIGDIKKYQTSIGLIDTSGFDQKIKMTIDYFVNNLNINQ